MVNYHTWERNRRTSTWNLDEVLCNVFPSRHQISHLIPRGARENLPRDMEDAYGSDLDNMNAVNAHTLIRIPRRLLASAGVGFEKGHRPRRRCCVSASDCG